jgi:hypothetical protein
MSDESTKHLIESYVEESEPQGFLSGFFKSPPQNFHDTEMVEIDILRDDESIAIPITDLSTGAHVNSADVYSNKGFTPPIFDEEGVITAYSQIKRQPGVNPFVQPDFMANAWTQAQRVFRKCENKIRRAVEVMASQVLQTGMLTLTNEAGAAAFELDFQPKATHFAAASAAWAADGSTGDPLKDIEDMATVIRRDGKKVPNVLIFGATAWSRFPRNAKVKELFNNRRADQVNIIPPRLGADGASYHGTISVGNYVYELWTYEGFYKHPVSGDLTPYVNPERVIMLASSARLDLSFGSIPMIRAPEERALAFLPARISSSKLGFDLTTNSYFTPDGKQLRVGCGTRPLTIPTAIDTFGCIDITP